MVVWDDILTSVMVFAAFAGCFILMVDILQMKMDLAWKIMKKKMSTV